MESWQEGAFESQEQQEQFQQDYLRYESEKTEQPKFLDDATIKQLKVIAEQEQECKTRLEKLADEKNEILQCCVVDDPYFATHKKIEFEEYGISIGITQPKIRDRKWITKQYESLDKKRAEIVEYEEDFKINGVVEHKSEARPFVKLLKIK